MNFLLIILSVMTWTIKDKKTVTGEGTQPYGVVASYSCTNSKGTVRANDEAVLTLSQLGGVTIDKVEVYVKSNKTGGAGVFTVSLNGTSQEPISVIPFTSDSFAVLCRDSRLYEMNSDGFTGRSCRLDFEDDNDNDIRESDSSNADKLDIQPNADGSPAFVIWNGSLAWYIDEERFTVRYRIDDFACAPADGNTVFIKDSERNKSGFFPIYSTQQLLDAAKGYLSALGEE